jgi:hypothetical protein
LTELTGTDAKQLLERFPERGMGIVPGREGDLGDVDGTHPQFSAGAFQAHPTYIPGNIFAHLGGEEPMKVGDGETRHRGQHFPIECLVGVFANVLRDTVDPFGIGWEPLRV